MNKDFMVPESYTGLERKNIPPFDVINMICAMNIAKLSRDPSTQVGAVIIDKDGNFVSAGYNSAPPGWDDSEFVWGKGYKGKDKIYEKYNSVIHAEDNAISNYKGSNSIFEGATIYVTLFPCPICAKMLAKYKFKRVVYLSDKYSYTPENFEAKRTFEYCGIEYERINQHDIESITFCLNDDGEVKYHEKINKTRIRK